MAVAEHDGEGSF